MPEFAVEMHDVVKEFDDPGRSTEKVYAVNHVTLQIKDGEFFSLLGPSGCGKTTSLRMIAGFELPTVGEVFLHGKPMGRIPPFQRAVNTVFQNYALFPHMTIGENVAFGLQMKGVPKADIGPRVKEALEMVRLPGYENRKPKQLSGGQQQRVALARALVNRPEVLLLDEPLGALDLKLRKEMQLELKTLQREVGITFVYVTHDQEEALTMSDRIGVMNKGKLLQVGNSSDIYDDPNCRFVADFIGETNFMPGIVKSMESDHVKIEVAGRFEFVLPKPRQPLAAGDKVTIMVRPEKGSVTTTVPGDPLCQAVQGRLLEVIYLGNDISYIVGLAEDMKLMIRPCGRRWAKRKSMRPS